MLYVLEEDNIHENSEYWYLTELAAKCTAKRLVPDYISEKKMKEYKEGNCFPCMGERKLQPRDYITNSYHIFVKEPINAFDKLYIESEFQSLSLGGSISYVETSDMTQNIPVILEIIKYIYDNIMYAELNTKSDYCQVCGYDGEIKIIDENNELIWECPNCKNRDKTKMNVARRTCGYIGTNFWNQGRTEEINERYIHLTDIAEDI